MWASLQLGDKGFALIEKNFDSVISNSLCSSCGDPERLTGRYIQELTSPV